MGKKNLEFFPLENLDIDVLKDLKKKFIEFDYNEDTIQKRLNLFGPYLRVSKLHYPLLKYLVNTKKSFDLLVSLFFLGIRVKFDKALSLFTEDEIKKLSEMNILKIYSNNKYIRSNVAIYPFKKLFFFTDFIIFKSYYPKHTLVYGLEIDSFHLANAIPEIKVDSVLDLCCGSGIHSIIASRISKNVTGVDINPRAINFAKFNAIFNNIHNVNFKLGDLYAPVKTKKFDIIIANCPFVATPYEKCKNLYRDSGKLGEYHIKKVIECIPQHLKENGICLTTAQIKKREGMSNRDVINKLIVNREFKILHIATPAGCTCILCNSVAHCTHYLIKYNFKRYEKELINWYKNLEKNKIKEISLDILCIKKSKNFYLLEKDLSEQNFDFKRTVEEFYYS